MTSEKGETSKDSFSPHYLSIYNLHCFNAILPNVLKKSKNFNFNIILFNLISMELIVLIYFL